MARSFFWLSGCCGPFMASAMRPGPLGLQMIPTFRNYSQGLNGFDRGVIWWMARLHLLPESYLFGMVDIRVFGKSFHTFILGNWYPHGVWWYFPRRHRHQDDDWA